MKRETFCIILNVVCAHDFYFVQCKDMWACRPFFHPKMHNNFANANI